MLASNSCRGHVGKLRDGQDDGGDHGYRALAVERFHFHGFLHSMLLNAQQIGYPPATGIFSNHFSKVPVDQDHPTNQLNVYHEVHMPFGSHDNCAHCRSYLASGWSDPIGEKVGTLNCQLARPALASSSALINQ
jgi:hypothetical protein